MTVKDVCAAVEAWAPGALAYDWDRAGLALGEPRQKVSKILVALTVTRDTFKAAVRARADMIVSHHPLIWDSLSSLRSDDPVARLCLDLAAKGIACFSAHTNLDVVPGGVNTVLADRLGLLRTSPLLPAAHAQRVKLVTFVPESHLSAVRDAVSAAGAGAIGDYTHCSFSSGGVGTFLPGEGAAPYVGKRHVVNEEPEYRFETLVTKARVPGVLEALFEAHPYEEVAYDLVTLEDSDPSIGLGLRGELSKSMALDAFAKMVRKALEVSHVRVVGKPSMRVKRVGVLGGSGGGSIVDVPRDLDVFVTGDVKYHDAIDGMEKGLAVIDGGHGGTEKWIVPVLAEYLKATLAGARVATFMEPEVFRAVVR